MRRPECKHTSNGGAKRWQYTQIHTHTYVYTRHTYIKIHNKIAQYIEIHTQRVCWIRLWWLISYHFVKSALLWLNYAVCSHFCQCRWQNCVSPKPRKSLPLTTTGSDCRDSPHESPGSETQGKTLPSTNWLHHLAVMCRRPLPLCSSSNGTSEDGDQSDETDVDIRCKIRLQPDSHELPLTAGTPRKKKDRGEKKAVLPLSSPSLSLSYYLLKAFTGDKRVPNDLINCFIISVMGVGGAGGGRNTFSTLRLGENPSHPSGVFKLSDYAKPREMCLTQENVNKGSFDRATWVTFTSRSLF